MNTTATIAQTLFCPAQRDLAAGMARLGVAMFGLALVALEGWLRLPIRPLFDAYLQSALSRVSSHVAAVFHRSL